MENKKDIIQTNVVKPKLSIFSNEIEYRLITVDEENNLESKMNEINDFMKNTSGKGKSNEEKDTIYAQSQVLWNQYAKMLGDCVFSFYLNRRQHQFIVELIGSQLEYDVNTVFIALELHEMLGKWATSKQKHKDDDELRGYNCNATECTFIYHLISKHTVKGLNKSTFLYAEFLRKISEVSKIINYYDQLAKDCSTRIQNWVASFEDGITVEMNTTKQIDENSRKHDTVKAKVAEPKKKTEKVK